MRVFEAAADRPPRGPASPILTHCERRHRRARAGPPARRRWASTSAHVALSHVDKVVDRGYHREIARDRRVRRVRPGRSAGATRRTARSQLLDVDDRGRPRRPDRARHGRRAAGLLRASTVAARADLAARRLHCGRCEERGLGAAVRRSPVRRQPGPGLRLRGASDRGAPDDRRAPHQRRRVARPAVVVRRPGSPPPERGEFGPADLAEMLDDAVDLALRDQEEAGIDVVTDGEMRRAGFFTAEFYRHLTGVRPLAAGPAARRRRPRPAAPVRGPRADRRAGRAGRRRGVPLRARRGRRGRSR